MCQELGNLSMVMEFLPGGSLDTYLANLKNDGLQMSPQEMFKIILGIARGMAHLAEAHIVHRDLAARNVLLDGGHEPRISDFGFSRIVSDSDQGKTNSAIGPIRWMAPENIGSMEYSTKSDVWSFGVVLYEITQKEIPYQGEDLISIATAIRDHARTPMPQMKEQPPAYIVELMNMCFQRLPEHRPSFGEIVDYLVKNGPGGDAAALPAPLSSAPPARSPPQSPTEKPATSASAAKKAKAGKGKSGVAKDAAEVEMQNVATRDYDTFASGQDE